MEEQNQLRTKQNTDQLLESGTTILINSTQLQLRGIFKLPPQPVWFPETENLLPIPRGRKEAVRLIDAIPEGCVIGYATKNMGNTDGDYAITSFTREHLINYIMEPATIPAEQAFIVQVRRGVIFPFNLPDISDLALHPKIVKIYLGWLLSQSTYEELNTIISTLLRETATEMPTKRETWYTQGGCSKVTFNSFGNYFKDVRVDATYANVITIQSTYGYTTTDPRDGRTRVLTVEAFRNEPSNPKRRRIMDSVIRNILIWNCRGVSSWGFITSLEHMMACHMPDFVLLLETRVIGSVMKKIIRPLGLGVVGWAEPLGGTGGLALLCKVGSKHGIRETTSLTKWECTIELK